MISLNAVNFICNSQYIVWDFLITKMHLCGIACNDHMNKKYDKIDLVNVSFPDFTRTINPHLEPIADRLLVGKCLRFIEWNYWLIDTITF